MPQKCAYFTLNLPNGFYLCHFFRDKDGKRPEFMPIFFHEDAFVFQPPCSRIYQDFPINFDTMSGRKNRYE